MSDKEEKITTSKNNIQDEKKTEDIDEMEVYDKDGKSMTNQTSKTKVGEDNEVPVKSEEKPGETNDDATSIGDNVGNSENEIQVKKTPIGIFFILGNEFCERFNVHGLQTILTLYLTSELNYSDNGAAQIYHGFKMTAYFMPLLGAIVADSWLGRFWTILYTSIVYALGNIITTIGSIPKNLSVMNVVSLTGLFIVAVGSGGLKPCVLAFGGDQFESDQVEQRQKFFAVFYLIVNVGNLLSTALTPFLRGDSTCFGHNSCFPLAFFIPSALFVVALVLFIIGKPLYSIKTPEGNSLVSFFKCIAHALARKITFRGEKKQHWLDYSDDMYNTNLIHDIKCVFRILIVFMPLPLYWALSEQKGSKWVLQATKMDDKLFVFHLKPDHMQLVNPLLVIVLIPIFQNIIYPFLTKLKLCRKPLQRMTVGGLLAALAFIVAGFIQLSIETEIPVPPKEGHSKLTIINNSPCNLQISGTTKTYLPKFAHETIASIPLGKAAIWVFIPSDCSTSKVKFKFINVSSMYESMMVTVLNNNLKIDIANDSRIKSKTGELRIRLFFSTEFEFTKTVNASFLIEGRSKLYLYPDNVMWPWRSGMTEYCKVKPGTYKVYMPLNGTSHEEAPLGQVHLRAGGSYIVHIYRKTSGSTGTLKYVETVAHNSVHMLFQVPQGILLNAGEIMFSITGLEFSYSQAPPSMKTVMQAAWLMTVAIGNLLVVILAHLMQFEKQSHEFFTYSGLMIFSMVTFGILAYFYKYVETEERH